MENQKRFLSLVGLILMLLACASGSLEVTTTPRRIAPTLSPTRSASETVTPSITPTQTLTLDRTRTAQFEQTAEAFLGTIFAPTFTSTRTPTPTLTFTPTPIPTDYARNGTPPPDPVGAISPDNAHLLREVARWGYGNINQVEHTPDGRMMLVQTTVGVYAYKTGTLDEIWRIEVPAGVSSMAVSPAGDVLALGAYYGQIATYQVSDGAYLDQWQGHDGEVLPLAFSPDGQILASGSSDETVRLWQMEDGKMLEVLRTIDHSYAPDVIFFTGDGQFLFTGDYDYYIWDVEDGSLVRKISDTYILAFSLDKEMYVTDEDLRWLQDGEIIHPMETDERSISSATFSPDGQYVARGDFDGLIEVWRVSDGRLLYQLQTEEEFNNTWGRSALSGPPLSIINSLDFSPDGEFLVSANGFRTVFLWAYKESTLLWRSSLGSTQVSFSSDGQSIISHNIGTITLVNAGNGAIEHERSERWRNYLTWIYGMNELLTSPDGEWLAQESRLWRLRDGSMVLLPRKELAVAFSADSQRLITVLDQKWVRFRRVSDLALVRQVQLEAPESITTPIGPYGFAVSPDGETMRALYWDDNSVVWRLSDGAVVAIEEEYRKISFSPDGQFIAVSSLFDTAVVQVHLVGSDGLAQMLFREFEHPGYSIQDVTFSSDSQLLAIAGYDYVSVWRVEDGMMLYEFEINEYSSAVAFSPDNQILAASYVNGFSLWRLSDGERIHSVEGPLILQERLCFSPDGRFLISASWYGTVRLWGVLP